MTATPYAPPRPLPPPDGRTAIDIYLAQQADLTAVARFSQRHEADLLPHHERYYRDLIPLERPGPGQQYAFEVDLDSCTGCKACVAACRSLNGLDEDESWRTVGLLHSTDRPYVQTVTTACHHCLDPACLSGCPVKAYEKDPVTGIVRHLDDQCIGCGYCQLTCPYEVPVYNASRGIVRKCDMCSDRLADGEAPACVQACPNEAIRITLVDAATVVAASRDATLVPGAPASSITKPATVYRTTRDMSGAVAADAFSVRPAHAHPPLAVMLVLTQMSVGAFVVDLALRMLAVSPPRYNAAAALASGLLALGASVLHLGRPRYAFRAVLGVRTSWLSREILAFGAFAGLAAAYACLLWLAPERFDLVTRTLGWLVALVGIAGMGCSVMVYAVTQREWWRGPPTAVRFALTAAVCGLATALFTSLAAGASRAAGALALALAFATVLKLCWDASVFRHLVSREATDLKRTAMLLSGDLARSTWCRFAAGVAGGLAAPALGASLSGGAAAAVVAGAGLAALVAGELIERSQFFSAVTAPRMPGGLV